MPADAAVKRLAEDSAVGLTREVDLQGAVDGHHVVVPGNNEGVVGIVDRPKSMAGLSWMNS